MRKKIYIDFSTTKKFPEINYRFKSVIKKAVKATLKEENFPYGAEVSVTLCDNDYIHALNKKYRDVDRATDVLSFPLYEDGNFDEEECFPVATLGDIVISVERAKEQAVEIGNYFLKEIAFLTVHSMLHLLGYDHERSKEEDEIQCRLQKKIVSYLNI